MTLLRGGLEKMMHSLGGALKNIKYFETRNTILVFFRLSSLAFVHYFLSPYLYFFRLASLALVICLISLFTFAIKNVYLLKLVKATFLCFCSTPCMPIGGILKWGTQDDVMYFEGDVKQSDPCTGRPIQRVTPTLCAITVSFEE